MPSHNHDPVVVPVFGCPACDEMRRGRLLDAADLEREEAAPVTRRWLGRLWRGLLRR